MKKIVSLIILLAVLSALLTGCYTVDQYNDNYDLGYEAGKQDGLSEGYENGKEAGYEKGYEEGVADGKETGKKVGRYKGYEEGNSDGWKEGYIDGRNASSLPDSSYRKKLLDKIAGFGNTETSTASSQSQTLLEWQEKYGVSSSPSTKSEIVYVTDTGSKYHKSWCGYLHSSKIPMYLSDAVSSYSPCSRCF